jgi:alkanesulfonate monooxygenase SsuD/methylene tetrahydromethanopterin reductase-like flavin-dependent oxidoreductase (luciferase family)
MFNANALKLGIFAANCSSGTAVTKVPERWDASWESNLALAQMADAAGIEFMLPIARWKGYGGETDFQGATLETITWAGGLLAHTRNMTVFGTVHAPLLHPVIAAKQMVTVDHIGRGRFGLNIVCGWNQDEFEMFGLEQREHDIRYDYGQEWWDVVRRLWTEPGVFDFDGRFIRLEGLAAEPKPWGGRLPIVMNAGSSGAGQAFAARNCDVMFTALVDFGRARDQLAAIHAQAARYGRKVQVYTSSHVVCRPTEREARDYHRHYAVENADNAAVEHLMRLQGLYAKSYPTELIAQFRTRFAGGHGSYPIVGDPDQVAAELKRIHDAGFAGATIAMVDYLDALPYIVQEVLPRLERLGVRAPAA